MAVDLDAIEAAICSDPSDPLAAMEAAPHLLAEVRRLRAEAATLASCNRARAAAEDECERLRADLAAANLREANARSVAVEAIALLDARLNPRTLEGYVFKDEAEAQLVTLRARLDSPADFAARVTAALDRLVEVAASEFPGSAKVDAARSEVDAAIGVAE